MLFGERTPASDSIKDRMAYILEQNPEARDDYKLAMAMYWFEFDGLHEVLGDRAVDFRDWFIAQATAPKSIQNRAGEVQNENPRLEACPKVARWRERQSRAGPPA